MTCDECPKQAKRRGKCSSHYLRWRLANRDQVRPYGADPEYTFWRNVDRTGGPDACWPWLAARDKDGYGLASVSRKMRRAHRVAYEFQVGPIPPGKMIDHLCSRRDCQNARHMEPVTNAVNIARGYTANVAGFNHREKTHCKWGHAFSPANTKVNAKGHRFCIACRRRRDHERRTRIARRNQPVDQAR